MRTPVLSLNFASELNTGTPLAEEPIELVCIKKKYNFDTEVVLKI